MQIIETDKCKIRLGIDSLSNLFSLVKDYSKVFILVDENTFQYCLPLLLTQSNFQGRPVIIQLKSGEIHKNIESCQLIWQNLLENAAERKSVLINLGGGVICDIGGFAASTFKRGIDFINIPTSLLAQVDASVGGKTGINFNQLKNQIGCFGFPKEVLINPHFLKTLSIKEWKCGWAEMIKHALIHSKMNWKKIKTFSSLLSSPRLNTEQEKQMEALIEESVLIKQKIVQQDPYENSERKNLNFGHTLGHAIESFSLEKDAIPLTHGEAIAIGIICESYISSKLLGLPAEELKDITQFMNKHYPHYNLLGFTNKLLHLMAHDKKNMNQTLHFSLLSEIGKAVFNQTCHEQLVIDSIEYYCMEAST